MCVSIGLAASSTQWTPKSMPNPMKTPAECGRATVAKSAICDPEHLLTDEGKDAIEGKGMCTVL